ncbi:acyl-ACP--UDP-N-acetylglucosamine O-acyltransferase [Sutterella sp.]|uniref:acyl-ACP--UDP-N-acetylglucosamine O-acyltransferase n=1 Tax=Sutterella sp. TaxID=1981025 RepID=UPI0026DEB576|nr:acyl-ACP--UDP-N-acetylglucosamine O-acyltransferase [Sutterella sp.]MDO5531186.1 acyl-ACP--UDP-N-acetylglucosamine O-acyltransferase [Sutterella sp.]
MSQIHSSSIVSPEAQIADDVVIGPFCIVGPNVRIGRGTVLRSHVVVEGRTVLGERNLVYAGACIGCAPQDKKYKGEDTELVVGDDNVIRENCTLAIGTIQDHGITRVGSRNLLMANAHVAHDCQVGDDIVVANNVALAGHVQVGSHAIIGGQAGIHQFVRIGEYAMVGGASGVVQDVPPYVICHLNPCKVAGLNLIGLRRAGWSDEQIRALRKAYGHLYRENLTVKEAVERMEALIAEHPTAEHELTVFLEFVRSSARGIIR